MQDDKETGSASNVDHVVKLKIVIGSVTYLTVELPNIWIIEQGNLSKYKVYLFSIFRTVLIIDNLELSYFY